MYLQQGYRIEKIQPHNNSISNDSPTPLLRAGWEKRNRYVGTLENVKRLFSRPHAVRLRYGLQVTRSLFLFAFF